MSTASTSEYAAVRHLLSTPAIAVRTAPYIRDDGFDWDGLLAATATLSGGEALIVRLAYDLWEAEGVVGVWELPRHLGPSTFGRVVDALRIYRGELAAEPAPLRQLDAA